MKHFILLFLLALTTSAQTYAVRFWGAGNTNGYPAYWPAQVQPDYTNYPSTAPWVRIAKADLDQCIATNRAAYQTVVSNAEYTAKAALDANIARLLQLYNYIPDARTTCRNFASGTNALTNTQRDAAIRQLADYMDKIMEFQYRLGPELKALYKPEDDPLPSP